MSEKSNETSPRDTTICGLQIGLIRPHVADPDVDWVYTSFDRTFGGYADPVVDAEFDRFVFRDVASTAVGLIWGVGGALYALVYPRAFPMPTNIMMYGNAFLSLAIVAVDLRMMMKGLLTASKARWRKRLTHLYGIVIVITTGPGLAYMNANCN